MTFISSQNVQIVILDGRVLFTSFPRSTDLEILPISTQLDAQLRGLHCGTLKVGQPRSPRCAEVQVDVLTHQGSPDRLSALFRQLWTGVGSRLQSSEQRLQRPTRGFRLWRTVSTTLMVIVGVWNKKLADLERNVIICKLKSHIVIITYLLFIYYLCKKLSWWLKR